ncbi:MAG: helix-turn-helix transcriptional regulator [Elusimicrobia bacterium]|nr:helix-turn-helix transcriptional regulator [Elusimicrobiota bacterium]
MADNIYGILGRRLREERKLAGLTLEGLGEKAGITGAFVAHIEAARKRPTLETVSKLACALKLPVSSLIEDPEPPQTDRDRAYIEQIASILRDRSPEEKQALVRVVRAASSLTEKTP